MKTRFLRNYLIVFCALILAACATPNKTNIVDADGFMRTGRFAVNYQSSLQDPYAAQGGFSWYDQGEDLTIDLTNPMGSILARILITADDAVLQHADGTTQSASTPDELLALVWGHSIPVAGLRYWIRGKLYPQAETSDRQQNNDGQLTSFKQLDWQISLSDYDESGPQKIRLLRADAQSRLSLRFMVN